MALPRLLEADTRAAAAVGLVVCSSIVFMPGAFDPYVWPKIVVAALGVLLAATAPARGRLPRELVAVGTLALVVVVVAACAGGTPWASLLGRFPRYEGLPVLGLYLACFWAGARLLGPDGGARRSALVVTASAVGVVVAAAAVLEIVGLPVTPSTDSTRTGTVVGNATDQGIVALLVLSVLLAPAVRERDRVAAVGAGAAVVGLATSGSRAALAVGALVVVVHLVRWRGARRATWVPLASALGALVALALAIPSTRDRLLSSGTVTGREVLWNESWRLVKHHLLIGVGPSRYVDAIGAVHDDTWVAKVGVAAPPDSPHLWPLQALSTGGFPLLLLAVAFAALVAWRGVERLRAGGDPLALGLLCAVMGYGLVLLTHFTAPATACLAMLLAGALVSRPVPSPSPTLARAGAIGVAAAAAVGVVAGMSFTIADVRLKQGVDAVADGRLAAADAAFTSAYRLRAHDGDVAMLAAQTLAAPASNGSREAATLTFGWASLSSEKTPDSYATGLSRGLSRIQLGDLAAAQADLDRTVSLFPTEPQVRVQRALARFGQGDVAGALSDLDEAQRLDPKDPTAARLRTAMLQRVGGAG